jgi:hypothetical protein
MHEKAGLDKPAIMFECILRQQFLFPLYLTLWQGILQFFNA